MQQVPFVDGLMEVGHSPAALHSVVRNAMRREYQLVERTLARLDMADLGDYHIALRIQHTALSNLTSRWREQDCEDFEVLMRCLELDLGNGRGSLGAPHCNRPRTAANSLRAWGVGYVFRAAHLRMKQVCRNIPAGFPAAYLNFSPYITWPRFLIQLDSLPRAQEASGLAQVIHGAKTTLSLMASLEVVVHTRQASMFHMDQGRRVD